MGWELTFIRDLRFFARETSARMVADVEVSGAVSVAASRRNPPVARNISVARRCAMVVGLVVLVQSQACAGSSPSLPTRGRRHGCFPCARSPAASAGETGGAGGGYPGVTGCSGVRGTGGLVRMGAQCVDVGMRSGTLRLRGGADAVGANVAAPNGQVLPA